MKKRLFSLLFVLLAVCVLHPGAWAAEEPIGSYNLENNEMPLYKSDFRNGEYVIPLEDNPFFPYEIQFIMGGQEQSVWFMDENDSVNVDGYTFRVAFAGTARELAFLVDGDRVAAYPTPKFFSDTGDLPPSYNKESVEVNLYGKLWSERKRITLEDLPGNPVVYKSTVYLEQNYIRGSVEGTYERVDGDYNFKVPLLNENYYEDEIIFELSIGSNYIANPENQWYQVHFLLPSPRSSTQTTYYASENPQLLHFEAYEEESDTRRNIGIAHSLCDADDKGSYTVCDYRLILSDSQWNSKTDTTWLSLDFGTEELLERTDLEVTVYEGEHVSEDEAIRSGAKNITAQMWRQEDMPYSGGYPLRHHPEELGAQSQFTLFFKRNHQFLEAVQLNVEVRLYRTPLVADDYLYGRDDWDDLYAGGKVVDMKPDQDFVHSAMYVLYDKNASLEDAYYVVIRPVDYATADRYWNLIIEMAAFGHFDSQEEFETSPDIKDKLCDGWEGGYLTTFEGGRAEFTIKTSEDETLHHFYITLLSLDQFSAMEGHEEAGIYPATSEFRDTLQMICALDNNHETPTADMITKINEHYDSYYYHGYQTIFQRNIIQDSDTIYPKFYSNHSIYAGIDAASGVRQISEETPVTFIFGQPIRYSASMSDGIHLANYWVTFVTPQAGGARLFVNAASNIDDSHRDTAEKGPDGEGLPVREVFLNSRYYYVHDILIANIGDEELTGLSVKLVGDLNDESVPPQNVRLDETWAPTESESLSLPAFNSQTSATDSPANVGWSNMTRVRLLTVTDEYGKMQEGVVSGYLIITSDNGGSMTIKLTGEAGEPRIVTETLETVKNRSFQAVRFVHYSTFLQTSSMYAKDKVKFTLLDGELPKGLTEDMDVKLSPNGELYGVPAETGTYEFVVRATFYGDENCYDDKTYTLIVADNTDANVSYGTGISDYQLLQSNSGDYNPAVGYDPASGDLILHSDAPFDLFVDKLVLDGEELRPGIDYTARDGSVIAQIRNLASRLSGNTSHTLSLENRAGGKTNQATKLTRTSVNVRTTEQVSSSKSGGSSTVKTVTKTPSRTAYAIHVSSASNGTVNVSASAAVSGKTVTITPNPNAGFTVQSVTVSGENIKGSVTVKKSGSRYTFTMPAKQVRVRVRFTDGKTTVTATDTVKTMPEAVDVKSTDWYYKDAVWAYDRGVLRGYQDSTFRAGTLMHWVSAVVTLERLDGVDVAAYDTGAEDGLNNSAWYVGAARWAVDNGIAPAPFGEYAAVSRGQYAVMLRNYLRFSGVTVTASSPTAFPDQDRMTAEEIEAFQILSQAGIFQGDSTGAMLPGNTLTRAHLAATLHRLSDYVIGYWEAKANEETNKEHS